MSKVTTQLLALLVIVLVIWFVLPLISIDQQALLPTVTERLIAISMVLFASLGYVLYQSSMKNTVQENSEESDDDTATKTAPLTKLITYLKTLLKKSENKTSLNDFEGPYAEDNLILTKHFQKVREYCRLNQVKKNLPVYVILGANHSGKTSLLNHSNLEFKTIPAVDLEDEHSFEETENKNCFWHINSEALFIDTPGNYANSEVGEKIQTPWLMLINLLLRKYNNYPLKGLIVSISIRDLLADTQQNSRLHLHLLKQRLKELKSQYGEKIDVQLVFTHWDAIPGFSEFFDNLTAEERQKAFEIHFNDDVTTASISLQFKQQYEALLQRMSQQLITKMHQEHDQKRRTLISQFPLQMEQLFKTFEHVVKQLLEKMSDSDVITPANLFFTSAQQSENDCIVDPLYQKLQTSFKLPAKQTEAPLLLNNKAYFIEGMFSGWLQCDKPPVTKLMISKKNQYAIYGTAAAVVLVLSGFIIYKFTDSLMMINKAETNVYALNLLKNKVKNSDAEKLAAANLSKQLNETASFWLAKKTFTEQNKAPSITVNESPSATVSTPTATSVALSTVTNTLNSYFTKTLASETGQPPLLYKTLKAYLMLSDPANLHYTWLNHCLAENVVANNIISATEANEVLQSLKQQKAVLKANSNLVEKARNQLSELPPQYIAFLVLQSMANNSNVESLTISLANQNYKVPFLFTAKGLQTLFLNNLTNAAQVAKQGNWVLGKRTTSMSTASIEQDLIQIYTANYINWWSKIYFGLQIPQFSNLQSIANFNNLLTDSKTGIVNAYTTILQNTDVDNILPAGSSNPTIEHLRKNLAAATHEKLASLRQVNLADLQDALNQFAEITNSIANSSNPNQAAFKVLQHQFANPQQISTLVGFANFANKLPQPLQSDVSSLAQQTKNLLASATNEFLQNQWQSQVVNFYNNNLANRYPLFNNAQQEISLKNFSGFFAPNGILQSFYHNYLASFIDSSQAQWQWKNRNGIQLSLDKKLLLAIERGRIITAMFFPNGGNKIQVSFTLQQVAMMPIVKSFQLSMNGQSLSDQQGSRNVSTFVWPGNSDDLGTLVTFEDVNGQHVSSVKQGLWSWFHILDLNQIKADNSSQKYTITFDVDGNEARYQLVAQNPINPFIPGILSSFRVPEKV